MKLTRMKIEIVAGDTFDCQKGIDALMNMVIEENKRIPNTCHSFSVVNVDYSATCEIEEVESGIKS